MLKIKTLVFSTMFMFGGIHSVSAHSVSWAKIKASYYLKKKDCQRARFELDSVKFQKYDAKYISLYAKTHLCDVGLESLSLELIDSYVLLNSLAALPTSNETIADSRVYQNIDMAIKLLIGFDGNTAPSTLSRLEKFGIKNGNKLSLQALKLLFAQYGKFLALYGNADSLGTQGNGTQTNSCLFSYTTSDAVEWIHSFNTGSCLTATGSEGSPYLSRPISKRDVKRRLCQGIIYHNNILDILNNLKLPSGIEWSEIKNILPVMSSLMSMAELAETGVFNDGNA